MIVTGPPWNIARNIDAATPDQLLHILKPAERISRGLMVRGGFASSPKASPSCDEPVDMVSDEVGVPAQFWAIPFPCADPYTDYVILSDALQDGQLGGGETSSLTFHILGFWLYQTVPHNAPRNRVRYFCIRRMMERSNTLCLTNLMYVNDTNLHCFLMDDLF